MRSKLVLPVFVICVACSHPVEQITPGSKTVLIEDKQDNPYPSIGSIPLPDGFTRMTVPQNSFASWLREIRLKKDKRVYKFDGKLKSNQSAQFAVLDVSVGNRDLQQCADAVMRLRAEYLFAKRDFLNIVFIDNDQKKYQFLPPYSQQKLRIFLENVFTMCGSASLEQQLTKHILITEVQPGDVLIHGGFPGHAVIVMDVATNPAGNKVYLLAQSYMPAQDIHVLINPGNERWSPWYEATPNRIIQTPEYTFTKDQLKRW